MFSVLGLCGESDCVLGEPTNDRTDCFASLVTLPPFHLGGLKYHHTIHLFSIRATYSGEEEKGLGGNWYARWCIHLWEEGILEAILGPPGGLQPALHGLTTCWSLKAITGEGRPAEYIQYRL